MEVKLPSGKTAVIRDQFMRADRREAERGLVVVIQPDGTRRLEGSPFTDIAGRILRRMLVSWDIGQPLPSQATSDHLAENILDMLDDGDWMALQKAVSPWVNRIMSLNSETFQHESGIKVQPASPADAEKLAALDGWEREGDGPKTLPPVSTPTAITSADGQPGPTGTG